MSVSQLPQTPQREPSGALFPLPLTAFETFMVADTTARYPMMADMQLNFQGRIDRTAFTSALAFAIARNPLFNSTVQRHRRRGLCWTPTNRLPHADWAPLGSPIDASYGEPVDLARDIGLRIWVREGDDRSTVLLHLHHACSDAIGEFGFVEDLLAGYANAYPGGQPVCPRPVDPALLSGRADVGMQRRSISRRAYDALIGLREGARFFLQSPSALPAASDAAEVAAGTPLRPGFISRTCSEEVTSGLRRLATQRDCTVNDILLRDLFLTLGHTGEPNDRKVRRGNLRILMPQNLRGREERAMPAANVSSFAFITRPANHCDVPDRLLDSIRQETQAIGRDKLSLYFLGSLASLRSAGLLPWVLRRNVCFATAVLTNLGDSTRRFVAKFPRVPEGLLVGNLVYEGLDGVPPVRPLTRAAFGIRNNLRTLTISLAADPHSYSKTDAARLLDDYMGQLSSTVMEAAVDPRHSVCENGYSNGKPID